MSADSGSASSSKLYSPRLLALSAQLADFPLSRQFAFNCDLRSRTCGSTITIGADLDGAGLIAGIGMQVAACAVGQSSAAVMAIAARGSSPADSTEALQSIENWLSGEGPPPQWPGFDALHPALPHKGRHEALLLPWRALNQALSTAALSSGASNG